MRADSMGHMHELLAFYVIGATLLAGLAYYNYRSVRRFLKYNRIEVRLPGPSYHIDRVESPLKYWVGVAAYWLSAVGFAVMAILMLLGLASLAVA
jgi:hypothetical protein